MARKWPEVARKWPEVARKWPRVDLDISTTSTPVLNSEDSRSCFAVYRWLYGGYIPLHFLVTSWSLSGHFLVTFWSLSGHLLVTFWSFLNKTKINTRKYTLSFFCLFEKHSRSESDISTINTHRRLILKILDFHGLFVCIAQDLHP